MAVEEGKLPLLWREAVRDRLRDARAHWRRASRLERLLWCLFVAALVGIASVKPILRRVLRARDPGLAVQVFSQEADPTPSARGPGSEAATPC